MDNWYYYVKSVFIFVTNSKDILLLSAMKPFYLDISYNNTIFKTIQGGALVCIF